jgi:anthranilate synthase/aminodeoxychorismate synthase-like glutamine amidotransferase
MTPVPPCRVFLLDNFDSFTYNIAHGMAAAGATVDVRRADGVDLKALEADLPDLLVLSPGPGRPQDAQVSLAAIQRFAGRVPIFGVCLGMQCLAVAYGGTVAPGPEPVHGKTSRIVHDGRGVFQGLPSPMRVARYHSLCVTEVPPCLEVTARSEDGIPMALRHRGIRMAGVQFHPDSFLTDDGPAILAHALRGDF